MRTSIALVPALAVAAALRPPAEFPEARPPAPPTIESVVSVPPDEALPRPGPLQAFVRAVGATSGLESTPDLTEGEGPSGVDMAQMRIVKREVARLLRDLYQAFRMQDFGEAVRLRGWLRRIDPHWPLLISLRRLALDGPPSTMEQFLTLQSTLSALEDQTRDDPRNPRIPEQPTLRFPSCQEWTQLGYQHWSDGISGESAAVADALDMAAVLSSTGVDLDVQNVPMGYVVEVLRGLTGRDLRLEGESEGLVTFKVSGILLSGVLKLLATPRNAGYRIDGSTIFIGPRDCARTAR